MNARIAAVYVVLYLLFIGTCVQMNGQIVEFDAPEFPLADTVYYPFEEGIQMIIIDHQTDYQLGMAQYAHMSQPPRIWWHAPLGNEYVFRDTLGTIFKTYNTALTTDTLYQMLRPTEYVAEPPRITLYHDLLFDQAHSGYYTVYNKTVHEDRVDPSGKQTLMGLINSKGELVLPIEYEQIQPKKDHYFLMRDGLWGATNERFEYVIPHLFESFSADPPMVYFHHNRRIVFAYDLKAQKAINLTQHEVSRFDDKHGILQIKQNDKWGLIDINTMKIVVPCEYNRVVTYYHYNDFRWLERGYVWVVKDGLYGLVSLKGKQVLPCISEQFYSEHDPEEGKVRVRIDGEVKDVEVKW